MTYRFALNINDEKYPLSPEDGLDIGDLSELTGNLKKTFNQNKKEKCTLSAIENHGYTPNFFTKSEIIYNKFIRVHNDIQEKAINDLTKEEAAYATTLKRILGETKYIEPLDKDKKPLFRLTSKDIDTTAENYSVITTASGLVSEIGSPKLEDSRHIYLHSCDFKIYISAAQEELLKEHFKKNFLEVKFKQRRSSRTGRILNAVLISFKVKPDYTLSESLAQLTQEELNAYEEIKTQDDILKLLRS